MKCQNCRINDANVFYTQNINGMKTKVCLCSDCAGELNLFDNFSNRFNFGFDRIFSNIFDDFGNLGLLELPRIVIQNDNMLENNYYDRDNTELDDALNKITQKNKSLSAKDKLERELNECIKKENYERAAEIRDELKKYKKD